MGIAETLPAAAGNADWTAGAGSPPLVSVLIITRNRHDELPASVKSAFEQSWRPLEVRVLENGSETESVRSNRAALAAWPDVVYEESSENLGVAGGRNRLLKQARGDIIVELDDDAVFEHEGVLAAVVRCFAQQPRTGVVAFRITNYYSGRITRKEYPFRDKRRDPLRSGPCAWFIGAGHAFRRPVVEELGGYRDFFPYGSEEQDFALRALDRGFELHYCPDAHVLHKQTPKARMASTPQLGGLLLAHRTKAALLNLPLPFAASVFLLRGLQMAVRYRGLSVFSRAAQRLKNDFSYIRAVRRPVRAATLWKLVRLRGMLLF